MLMPLFFCILHISQMTALGNVPKSLEQRCPIQSLHSLINTTVQYQDSAFLCKALLPLSLLSFQIATVTPCVSFLREAWHPSLFFFASEHLCHSQSGLHVELLIIQFLIGFGVIIFCIILTSPTRSSLKTVLPCTSSVSVSLRKAFHQVALIHFLRLWVRY